MHVIWDRGSIVVLACLFIFVSGCDEEQAQSVAPDLTNNEDETESPGPGQNADNNGACACDISTPLSVISAKDDPQRWQTGTWQRVTATISGPMVVTHLTAIDVDGPATEIRLADNPECDTQTPDLILSIKEEQQGELIPVEFPIPAGMHLCVEARGGFGRWSGYVPYD